MAGGVKQRQWRVFSSGSGGGCCDVMAGSFRFLSIS